jgi:hypothetical protein
MTLQGQSEPPSGAWGSSPRWRVQATHAGRRVRSCATHGATVAAGRGWATPGPRRAPGVKRVDTKLPAQPPPPHLRGRLRRAPNRHSTSVVLSSRAPTRQSPDSCCVPRRPGHARRIRPSWSTQARGGPATLTHQPLCTHTLCTHSCTLCRLPHSCTHTPDAGTHTHTHTHTPSRSVCTPHSWSHLRLQPSAKAQPWPRVTLTLTHTHTHTHVEALPLAAAAACVSAAARWEMRVHTHTAATRLMSQSTLCMSV